MVGPAAPYAISILTGSPGTVVRVPGQLADSTGINPGEPIGRTKLARQPLAAAAVVEPTAQAGGGAGPGQGANEA